MKFPDTPEEFSRFLNELFQDIDKQIEESHQPKFDIVIEYQDPDDFDMVHYEGWNLNLPKLIDFLKEGLAEIPNLVEVTIRPT